MIPGKGSSKSQFRFPPAEVTFLFAGILESKLSYARKEKSQLRFKTELAFAEKEGFEPPVPVRVQRFSRPPRSTTPAFLL